MFEKLIASYVDKLGSSALLTTLRDKKSVNDKKVKLQTTLIEEMQGYINYAGRQSADGLSGKKLKTFTSTQATAKDKAIKLKLIQEQLNFVQTRQAALIEIDQIDELSTIVMRSPDDEGAAMLAELKRARAVHEETLRNLNQERQKAQVERLGVACASTNAAHGSLEKAAFDVGRLQLTNLQSEAGGSTLDLAFESQRLLALVNALRTMAEAPEDEQARRMGAAVLLEGLVEELRSHGKVEGEGDGALKGRIADACRVATRLLEQAVVGQVRVEWERTVADRVLIKVDASLVGDLDEGARQIVEKLKVGSPTVPAMEAAINARLDTLDAEIRRRSVAALPTGEAKLVLDPELLEPDDLAEYRALRKVKLALAQPANDIFQQYFRVSAGGELIATANGMINAPEEQFLADTASAYGDYNSPSNLGRFTYHLTALSNILRETGGIAALGLIPSFGGTLGGSSGISDNTPVSAKSSVNIRDASIVNSENKVAVASNRKEGLKIYVNQRENKVDGFMAQDDPGAAVAATSVMLRFPIRVDYLGKFGADPMHLTDNLRLLDGTEVPKEDIEVLVHRQWIGITDPAFLATYREIFGLKPDRG